MATQPRIRYYLGAYTPSGFHSLYYTRADPGVVDRLVLLKGGADCARRTFLGKLAADLADVHEILTPGSATALDGIYLPARNTLILDSVPPHVVEPSIPGLHESYIDAGMCCDQEGLKSVRETLAELAGELESARLRLCRSLRGATELEMDRFSTVCTPAVVEKIEKRARGIVQRELRGEGNGEERCCYLSGLTTEGYVTQWDTIAAQCPKIYELSDRYGLATKLLAILRQGARDRGHEAIVALSPLKPWKVEHLLLPQLGLAFVTSTPEQSWPGERHRRVRLDAMVEDAVLETQRARLRFLQKMELALLEEGRNALVQSQEVGAKIAEVYAPYVNGEQLEASAEHWRHTLTL